jgi:hypothetical protein
MELGALAISEVYVSQRPGGAAFTVSMPLRDASRAVVGVVPPT